MDLAKALQTAAGNAGGDFYPYTIDNSARFDKTGEHTLTRTFSTGDVDNWAVSCWVKICDVGVTSARCEIISAGSPATNRTWIYIDCNTGQFKWQERQSSTTLGEKISTRLFRDTSAWYHIFCLYDSDNGTATDRMQVYINGVKETDWDTDTTVTSGQNSIMNSAVIHGIGITSWSTSDSQDSSYKAQHVFVDGGGVTVDDFGQDKNGVWIPKSPSVTYGTNGHYLAFQDSSNLGDDTSGNTNDWTVSGLTSSDQMTDTPTNNFATVSPLAHSGTTTTALTLSEGNLKTAHNVTGQWQAHKGTMPVSSGKWYYEVQITTRPTATYQNYNIGFYEADVYNGWYYSLTGNLTYGAESNVGKIFVDTAKTTYGTLASSNGDIYMFALDVDNEKFWVGLNGTWMASGNPSTGANPSASGFGQKTWVSHQSDYAYNTPYGVFIHNYGQDSSFAGTKTAQGNTDANGIGDFYYTVPTGFSALCTANLSEPTIGPNSAENVTDYFNSVIYTGNGTAIGSGGKAVTGVGFQPDLVTIKNIDTTDSWIASNIHKGASTYWTWDDETHNVTTDSEAINSFDSDGFTVGNYAEVNTNAEDYIAYCFKTGNSTATNNDGTISCDVSVDSTKPYMSILEWTGTGANGTLGHGLGVAPELFIVHDPTTSTNPVLAMTLPVSDPETDNLRLALNNVRADSATFWNDTAPTSSVISLGTTTAVNGSGGAYVGMAFASMEGMCKVGYYEGNGSTDGPFIYTGFRPAWILLKRTDAVSNWRVTDNKSYIYNPARAYLRPDDDGGPSNLSTLDIDLLSNGFKQRGNLNATNASGGNYIFLALAEMPFKYSNAR